MIIKNFNVNKINNILKTLITIDYTLQTKLNIQLRQ